jgi:hypothetical protein
VPEPAILGPHDEPQDSGALVAVHYGDYHHQEIWVRSGANIGNWYPLGGEFGRPRAWSDPRNEVEKMIDFGRGVRPPCPGPGEVPLHPHWEDVLKRGPVTLLVAGDAEVRAAGWAAGRRRLLEQIEGQIDND